MLYKKIDLFKIVIIFDKLIKFKIKETSNSIKDSLKKILVSDVFQKLNNNKGCKFSSLEFCKGKKDTDSYIKAKKVYLKKDKSDFNECNYYYLLDNEEIYYTFYENLREEIGEIDKKNDIKYDEFELESIIISFFILDYFIKKYNILN